MTTPSHPKTQGFFASLADTAVILFRPSRQETFCLRIDYNKAGRFKVTKGARFTGRFYPSRCDLSPDGTKFLYFVMGAGQENFDERYPCWTAISSPPSLTALFLLPHYDTWGGGGKFISRNTVLISNASGDKPDNYEPFHNSVVHGIRLLFDNMPNSKNQSYTKKTETDQGWRLENQIRQPSEKVSRVLSDDPAQHILSGKAWVKKAKGVSLIKTLKQDYVAAGDFSAHNYLLLDKQDNPLLPTSTLQTLTWADFDRYGRLWLAHDTKIEIFHKPAKTVTQPHHVINLTESL